MITFKPVLEAETPEGFPRWTPVGKIEVKEYPAYRLARYEMQLAARDNSAFFILFNHIKKKKIEMTAPVQMEYRLDDGKNPQQTNMAFLYGSTAIGKKGEMESGVKVNDIPAGLLVSIGMRGQRSQAQIESIHSVLKSWLKRNRGKYAADGPLRVMDYNSPFVQGNRRYYEIQIPIRLLTAKDAKLPH